MKKEDQNAIIPKNWAECKLKDIGEIVAGGTPSTNEPSYWGDVISWITPADLSGYNSMFIEKGRKSITEKGLHNSSAKLLPKGSVLFSSRAPIGYVVIAANKLATNQGFKNIIPYSGINSKYLYYYLFANKHLAEESASGTTFKEISASKFAELPIKIPPLNEQNHIVEKLDELFSELDKGKEQLQTALEQLKVYRQSILKHAFEGKLTKEDIIENKLPKGWVKAQFNDVTMKIGDIDHKMPQKVDNGTYPYISTGDINKEHELDFEKAKKVSKEDYISLSKKIKPEKGDTIFPRYGTIGRNVLVKTDIEFLVSYSCGIIKPDREKILPKYLYYYSLSPQIKNEIEKHIVQTTQANVGISSIKLFEINYPLLIESQKLVVSKIEYILSSVKKAEDEIINNLSKVGILKQSLLQKAFEGKLVVQDPNDEPASLLLERIKKEKEQKTINNYFYQIILLGLILRESRKKEINHGEMTLAKYAYLLDKIYKIPTFYNYQRWHLGPYTPDLKKAVNNKKFFKKSNNHIELNNEEVFLKYNIQDKDKIESAIEKIVDIFSHFESKQRSHKTELLATVYKVVEDIRTTNLKAVYESMKVWEINLKGKTLKTKADKFDINETEKCLKFIIEKGWDKKLIN